MKMYLDANVIIFGYEASEPLRSIVRSRLWHWCVVKDGGFVTSVFSRLECRIMPLRDKNHALLAEYDNFFGDPAIELVDVTSEVIDLAAQLCAKHRFKSADAVHLASAVRAGAQVFLTADVQLSRCSEITVEIIHPDSI